MKKVRPLFLSPDVPPPHLNAATEYLLQVGFSSAYDFSFQTVLYYGIRPSDTVNSTCGNQEVCTKCFPVAPYVHVFNMCSYCYKSKFLRTRCGGILLDSLKVSIIHISNDTDCLEGTSVAN